MKSKKVVLNTALRISYANVFTPKADPSGRMKYSVSLLIRKDDEKSVALVRGAVKELLADPEVRGILKTSKDIDTPLRDGDEKDDPNYAGCWYLNAKANEDRPPKIFDREKNEILDKAEVYSGCYCQASLSLYAYNKSGHKGIGVGLNALRKMRDGEPLGGGGASASDFEDEEDEDLF